MRVNKFIGVAAVVTILATTANTAAAWTPWDSGGWGGNNWSPWGGNNNWTPWGGNNRSWGGNNWSPWGGNNNWTPWGGNNRSRSSSYYRNRYGYAPYGYTPYGYNPYQNPYQRNYRRKKKNDWMPWDNGPFGDMSGPWDSGPWNPDWTDGRWTGDDIWGAGPKGWSDPNDPKGSMSRFWDDMLKAPYEFGEMPGGWTAPSISVPNPVEVGDEFEGSSRKAPKEAAEQMDNFRYN